MSRLNLTLDEVTHHWIKQHASQQRLRQATLARQLLQEAVARRAELERKKRLAADYAAGRDDARELLDALERGQLDFADDE